MHHVKISVPVLLLMVFLISGNACSGDGTEEETVSLSEENDIRFDERLAEELGADDYGMRRYVLAFLKAGPNRNFDEQEAAELQRAHMANINRLAEEGKLILAGPFLDDGEFRGIYLFDTESEDEARIWTETDPAIRAGSLEMELHPWYGSAALLKMNEIHSRIARERP